MEGDEGDLFAGIPQRPNSTGASTGSQRLWLEPNSRGACVPIRAWSNGKFESYGLPKSRSSKVFLPKGHEKNVTKIPPESEAGKRLLERGIRLEVAIRRGAEHTDDIALIRERLGLPLREKSWIKTAPSLLVTQWSGFTIR